MNKFKGLALSLMLTSSLVVLSNLAYANKANNNTVNQVLTQNVDFSQLTDEQLLSITDQDLSKLTANQLKAYIVAIKNALAKDPSLKAKVLVKIQKAQVIEETVAQTPNQVATTQSSHSQSPSQSHTQSHHETTIQANHSPIATAINKKNTQVAMSELTPATQSAIAMTTLTPATQISKHDQYIAMITDKLKAIMDYLTASGTTWKQYDDIDGNIDGNIDGEPTGEEYKKAFAKVGVTLDGTKLATLAKDYVDHYAEINLYDIIDPLDKAFIGIGIITEETTDTPIDIDDLKAKVQQGKITKVDFSIQELLKNGAFDNTWNGKLGTSLLTEALNSVKQADGTIDVVSLAKLNNKYITIQNQGEKFEGERDDFSRFMIDIAKYTLDNTEETTLNMIYDHFLPKASADGGIPLPFAMAAVKVPVNAPLSKKLTVIIKNHVNFNNSSRHYKKKYTAPVSYYSHDDHHNRHTSYHHNTTHATFTHYKKKANHTTPHHTKKHKSHPTHKSHKSSN